MVGDLRQYSRAWMAPSMECHTALISKFPLGVNRATPTVRAPSSAHRRHPRKLYDVCSCLFSTKCAKLPPVLSCRGWTTSAGQLHACALLPTITAGWRHVRLFPLPASLSPHARGRITRAHNLTVPNKRTRWRYSRVADVVTDHPASAQGVVSGRVAATPCGCPTQFAI